MVNLTWYEAVRYCNWLSKQEGVAEDQWCYRPNGSGKYAEGMRVKENHLDLSGYRLPTDSEWEYACRAHSSTSRYYGTSVPLLPEYGWYALNAESRSYPVGRLKPNDFGLFDMHGNANEWCHDIPVTNREEATASAAKTRASEIVSNADNRILRGGSFRDIESFQRSANRDDNGPDARNGSNGLRVARTYP
ncbi:MAG: formylglycine-generating enzyme family protein, partial [Planctomycetaceae bacterium]